MSEKRGNGWFDRIAFAVLISLLGWLGAGLYSRVGALEEAKSGTSREVTEIKWDLKGAREDICGLKGDIADLREELTKRPVYRRPCP